MTRRGEEILARTPPTGIRYGFGEHVSMDIWHGVLPNEDAAALLKEDGDFLMRSIEKGHIYYTLISVRRGKEVLNAAINEASQGKYEFQGEVFETMKELLDRYHTRKCPLIINGVSVVLTRPIRRRQWQLRHRMIALGKEIGTGSYGTVYKGTLQLENQKPITVAIKVLTEMAGEASSALWKEARNHILLDHPNVVKMYGVANDFSPPYLVMEYIAGGSVDNYLKKRPKLGVAARLQILVEAAAGLEYIHSKGLIHRDIAARNLLIEKVVKVSDFGMSRKSDSYRIDPTKPMNLRWLAPEVFTTKMVNKCTDVYAFGVTIWECFVVPYVIPYQDWKSRMVYDKVVTDGYRLDPPKLMPEPIAAIMHDCLGPDRYRPTFKVVLERLRAYISEREAVRTAEQNPAANRSRMNSVYSSVSSCTASPCPKSTLVAISPAATRSLYFMDHSQYNNNVRTTKKKK